MSLTALIPPLGPEASISTTTVDPDVLDFHSSMANDPVITPQDLLGAVHPAIARPARGQLHVASFPKQKVSWLGYRMLYPLDSEGGLFPSSWFLTTRS